MSKHVTQKDLENSHSMTDVLNIGDSAEDEIVENLICLLPPETLRRNFFQLGEPYAHRTNPETGRCEPVFITFEKKDGTWFYKGLCFSE